MRSLPNRRRFMKGVAGTAVAMQAAALAEQSAPVPATTSPTLAAFPEKTDLILLTDRPPQLETPLKYFQHDITPNDAMFVRWHLSGIPATIDLETYRLTIGGHVDHELSLSMADLKQFEQVSIVAVNQCSGNSRSLFEPRVPGGQWANGAMGNARWTGVRLADVLNKAGIKAGAVEVSFRGLDRPALPATPAFAKSLKIDKARDRDVIIAYAMNGQPLPMLNGFPLRLVVPGWFATYWIKALDRIDVLNEPFHSFWMDKAYRVPINEHMEESPTDLAKDTTPITAMPVRSLIVRPEPAERVVAGAEYTVNGIAFDGGSGIKHVDVSFDEGKSWRPAALGPDLGKYSFRRWSIAWTPTPGTYSLQARATSNAGQTQPVKPNWNRSGYARNVIETLKVSVL